MKQIKGLIIILLLASASVSGKPDGHIRQFFGNLPSNSSYIIDKEYLLSGDMLQMFYFNRIFTPAWTNQNSPAWNSQTTPAWMNQCVPARNLRNMVGKNAHDLLDYIRKADQHGLQPEDFHLNMIDRYIGNTMANLPMITIDTLDLMKLDVLLTDAFLLLGTQLYYGKVDPAIEVTDWEMQQKEPLLRFDIKLEEALAANDLGNGLDHLAPKYNSYWMMKKELAFFLKLKDQSWPALLSKTTIKPGDTNQLMSEIRDRLLKLRYPLSDSTSLKYDEELEMQLKLFQKDWGLNSDSIIGKGILDVLNTKPEKLINKLKVNMERFRWLPLEVTRKYIIVNIANFALDLIDGTDTLLSMRVIVGKDYRKTPIFNEKMTYIVFSPSWIVPPTILENDVIPELLKGPAYLKKMDMHLLRPDGSEIAYSDIDWTKISKKKFKYMVRQDPGPGNSLGRVKFMFPNIYDIYIHDTPKKGSFANNNRALSSGCIRAEKPYELAVMLLSDLPEWSNSQIQSAMEQDKEQRVNLKTPVDVVVIYLTAWSDGNSRLQFRKDVYERDGMLLKALDKKQEAVKYQINTL